MYLIIVLIVMLKLVEAMIQLLSMRALSLKELEHFPIQSYRIRFQNSQEFYQIKEYKKATP